MKKLLLASVAAAVLAGGAAMAQTAQPGTSAPPAATAQPAKPAQHARHARHAGMMTPDARSDVPGRVAKMFARLDTNHDGYIAKDEVDALQSKRHERMEQRADRFDPAKIFARIDANHDGQITVAEAEAAHNRRTGTKSAQPESAQAGGFRGLFARADTNKDGSISQAEFDAMGTKIHARMERAAMARGPAGHLLDSADTDKDGKVSLAEAQQLALTHFDRVDLNHDGTITREERRQARQQFRAQHHPS